MKQKKPFLYILYGLLFTVLFVSAVLLVQELSQNKEEIETFETLQQLVTKTAPASTSAPPVQTSTEKATTSSTAAKTVSSAAVQTTTAVTTAATSATTAAPEPMLTRDLPALFALNRHCIGWIEIADTKVNYPVMHTPEDPEHYLRRSFFRKYSRSGVPFLDGRCTMDSENLFIYGHNMKNGTMFSDLLEYSDPAYLDTHPIIELETAAGCKTYRIFAAASVSETDAWYQNTGFADADTYDRSIRELLAVACYETGLVPTYGQQLLTLSTCDNTDDATRFLVVAAEDPPAQQP